MNKITKILLSAAIFLVCVGICVFGYYKLSEAESSSEPITDTSLIEKYNLIETEDGYRDLESGFIIESHVFDSYTSTEIASEIDFVRNEEKAYEDGKETKDQSKEILKKFQDQGYETKEISKYMLMDELKYDYDILRDDKVICRVVFYEDYSGYIMQVNFSGNASDEFIAIFMESSGISFTVEELSAFKEKVSTNKDNMQYEFHNEQADVNVRVYGNYLSIDIEMM